jgi:outer membrane protein assembly factor BamB
MAHLTLTTTFDAPGRGPAGLAWDGRALWNADYMDGAIFRIDPATGRQTGALVCPGNLSGLAWDGRALWQSLHDAGWLRRVNPETNDFDQTIVVHDYGWLSGLAWDGRHLWAVSQQMGQLVALDSETGEVVRAIPAPVAGGGLAFHDGALWLGLAYPMMFDERAEQFEWVGDEQNYAVLQLDPANGREIGRYALDFLPMGLAWVDGALWLSHAGRRKLYQARLV